MKRWGMDRRRRADRQATEGRRPRRVARGGSTTCLIAGWKDWTPVDGDTAPPGLQTGLDQAASPGGVVAAKRQIVTFGGGGFSMEAGNPLLDEFVLNLTGRARPRVCFLPQASGDADHYIVRFYRAFPADRCLPSHLSLFRRAALAKDPRRHLLDQDLIYVGGRQREEPARCLASPRDRRASCVRRGTAGSCCVASRPGRCAGSPKA